MLFNIISIYFFIMIIAVLYCIAYVRSLNGSGYMFIALLLSFSICIYLFGYVMELDSGSHSQILFWNTFEYLGIPFVSALWLTLTLRYTGHFSRYKKFLYVVLYLIPLTSMVLRFTNDFHHFYFASVSFVGEYGRTLLMKAMGPWDYVQMVHSMTMLLVSFGFLLYDSIKSRRGQAGKVALVAGGTFFAGSGLILSAVKPFGFFIDYMALCLPVTCLMIILAILRYDFLEAKSMARKNVFEASRDAILLTNRQNKVIDYNSSAKQLFAGISIVICQGYIAAQFKDYPDLFKSLESIETSVVSLNIDGEDRYYEISTKEIDSSHSSHGWIKTIRDITETYKLNESLKRQALMDELSGLSNRRAFMQTGREILDHSFKTGETLHLMMMDLDHFKQINDRYGHHVGDQVIRDFSRILRGSLPAGMLIARLGGEEFAVLLPAFDDAEALQMANLVLENIRSFDHSYQNEKFHVTVSVGIAQRTQAVQTLDKLMQMADKALYESKGAGRNRVTVYG